MKWFHHDTDMHRNRKVRKLIRVHGATGYAFWSVLLEKIYANEDGFQIEADELWFEDIAEDLKLGDYRTPIRILDTLAELGMIDKQLWADHVVFCPAIAERGDRYIVKRTYEREKKRKQRASKNQKRNDEGQFAEMSLGDTEGTKGQVRYLSPSDPDPDPDPDPDLNKGLNNKPERTTKAVQARLKQKNAVDYSQEFEFWWNEYREFCLQVDKSPGVKKQAFLQFSKIHEKEKFSEGWQHYRECKLLEFKQKGDAIGVSHACRFISNDKWVEAYDHKLLKAKQPKKNTLSKINSLLTRLNRTGELPDDWHGETGCNFVSELSEAQKLAYLDVLELEVSHAC